MNQKTSKLLRKYANETNKDVKDLKKEWKSLEWKQREDHRLSMINEIAKTESK